MHGSMHSEMLSLDFESEFVYILVIAKCMCILAFAKPSPKDVVAGVVCHYQWLQCALTITTYGCNVWTRRVSQHCTYTFPKFIEH